MILELFQNLLTHTGAGVDGNATVFFLVSYGQMFLATCLSFSVFFRVMKRDSIVQTIFLSLAPACLMVTVAIVEPLFMGSFLGGKYFDMPFLEQLFLQKPFYVEVAVLLLLYVTAILLTKWYIAYRKLAVKHTVSILHGLSMVAEVVAVLGLGALCAWRFFGSEALISRWGIWLVSHSKVLLWLVFGIYTVAYKTILSFFAIGWSALFGNRELHLKENELEYNSEGVLLRIIQAQTAYIWQGFMVFSVFYYFVLPMQLKNDPSVTPKMLSLFLGGFAVLVCITVVSFVQWLLPKRSRVFRQFQRWEPQEYYMRRFCKEFGTKDFIAEDGNGWRTHTFYINKMPFDIQRVYSTQETEVPQAEQ